MESIQHLNSRKRRYDENSSIIEDYLQTTQLNNDLNEAAKNLYTCLRIIKNKGYKSIAVEKIPYKGLGRAINDRLHRAAKFKTLKS